MKELFVTFARANEESNKAIIAILAPMGAQERDKSRKSYYGSLSSLFRHVYGGTCFFLGLFKECAAKNPKALAAIESLAKVEISGEKKLTDEEWKKQEGAFKKIDKAYVDFVSALSDKDMSAPVKFKGKEFPLFFMLQKLVTHGIHHRGQISQILDSLKIDNDYSGINEKFLAK